MSTPPRDRTTRFDRSDHGPRFGPTRARVLAVLQDLGEPATVADVAARLGSHSNTARFHLEALVGAGLVERHREDRSAPGRPRTHYVATATAPLSTQRSYRLLAEILTAHLAATSEAPSSAGADAGREYGRLAVHDGERVDTPAAAADAVAVRLAGMGFESRPPTADGDDFRLDVVSCPFLEVATENLDVVCSVHRGLMEGLLDGLHAPIGVTGLQPLVGPSHCVARLGPVGRRSARAPHRSAGVSAR